jgi:hypothetical protein
MIAAMTGSYPVRAAPGSGFQLRGRLGCASTISPPAATPGGGE